MTAEDTVILKISDVVYRGKGLARLDGQVVFVPRVIAGETVKASIVRKHKNHSEAALVEIIERSPDRIEPVCPLASECPGCCYQHIAYKEEVKIKQAQLCSLLERQAHVDSSICLPPTSSPKALGYRNKISLHIRFDGDALALGYVAEDNSSIMDVSNCPLGVSPINDELSTLRSNESFLEKLRDKRNLTLRWTKEDGVVHFFGKGDRDADWLTETTSFGTVKVPRSGFFQVNHAVADLLVANVLQTLQHLRPGAVIDLYSGVGIFGIAASKAGVERILGVDSDSQAIAAAKQNLHHHRIVGAEFIPTQAGKGARQSLRKVNTAETALILDPPRTGLEQGVVDAIAEYKPAYVIYVSCAADTMARDIVKLAAFGYKATKSQLFDMFPRTPYFETVTTLVL